ncbi:MAG: YafY family protein [Chloroflexota bacterium]
MYYPSTRLFSVLELLQAHPTLTGAKIAEKLEVDGRTVRRYVTRLQEMGIPIETVKGRYGGYRLDQKFKLPPLVFQSDEVLALSVGLMFASRLHLAGITAASERAIHKIERVMPQRMIDQLNVLNEVVEMEPVETWYALSADVVLDLSQAVYDQQAVWIAYGDRERQTTRRKVDPYALVFMIGMWYVVGYCHLREALRTFRVDRIQSLKKLSLRFEKPEDFDAQQMVEESIARTPNVWTVELLFHGSLEEARRILPKTVATFTERPNGILVSIKSPSLEQMARFILGLEGDFEVMGPPEIRAAFQKIIIKSQRLMSF